MDSIALRQKEDVAMEVPELDGDMLVELLDASLVAEDGDQQQLGFASAVDVDGECWIDSQELGGAIHTHQDCEDCGLDGILSDFEEYERYPAPCVVFDDGEWAETGEAAMGPFAGGCMGDWYMDGMVMGLMAVPVGWEEEEGGEGSAFSFEPCYGGGEAGTEQVYGSPLWE